jgi:UDP-apiose/xylose synthase
MRILILGAGGFIGSHLTERLLNEGHIVVGVDIHHDKIREFLNHNHFIFIEEDIGRKNCDVDALVRDSNLVINLIAYANPGLYVKMPLEVFRLNFLENLKVVESCVQQNKRLIQFSSCEVYGKTIVAVTDANLKNPENPAYGTFYEDNSEFILGPVNKHRWIYASAKQLLERVIHAYGIEKSFNYTIIRPFNFIGPKIDYLLDETDGIPRVFSFFMDALINGTQMNLVEGGYQRRCYTYIDDAIECIYRIVENSSRVCERQIFNIGSPQNEVTIRELAEIMIKIYAEKFKKPSETLPEIVTVSAYEFYGEGYDDSDRRIPDISKARRLLGWEPKFGIPEMLEATMHYYVTEYYQTVRKDGKL